MHELLEEIAAHGHASCSVLHHEVEKGIKGDRLSTFSDLLPVYVRVKLTVTAQEPIAKLVKGFSREGKEMGGIVDATGDRHDHYLRVLGIGRKYGGVIQMNYTQVMASPLSLDLLLDEHMYVTVLNQKVNDEGVENVRCKAFILNKIECSQSLFLNT